ncbi:MAG: tripartite tricarboxylate transporter substrate-binding protein [Desulfobacterales bacterium]|nr:tripartite tricarboxylate transporter substrate-binding protein [Desulfobacterales bacterium]
MKKMMLWPFMVIVAAGLAAGPVTGPTPALAEKPFYEGKTIEVLGESRVGGGTDTLARIIAAIIPKYIPGKPNIVVRSLPGGAGAIANNIFYAKGKPDGLHLLMNSGSPISLQLRSRDIVRYDLRQYRHIGNVSRAGNLILVNKAQMNRLFDPGAQPLVVGTKEGEERWMAMLMWGKEFLGWNIRWIPGYSGTSGIELAFQRGEIDMFGTSNAFIINRMVKNGDVSLLTQGGIFRKGNFSRRPDFPDVPTFIETLGDKKPAGVAWQGYIAWMGTVLLDKFLVAPRGTPDQYVNILTAAFEKMSADPKFDSLVKRMVSEVYQVSVGTETTQLLQNVLDVPKEALDYGRSLQRKFGIIPK